MINDLKTQLRPHAGKIVVVKYGGSAMEDPSVMLSVADDIAQIKRAGVRPIVVHGGGKEISRWMTSMGQEARFIDGLRYTDQSGMEIIEMVLRGKINGHLVSLINNRGADAVGLSGKDGALFTARKITSNGKDLGLVGEIRSVRIRILETLLEKDFVPVVCSVAASPDGETLNLNADHVAAELAIALKVRELIYLTDVDAIMIDGQPVRTANVAEAQALLEHPEIKGGMLPKVRYAVRAAEGGVGRVHILNAGIEHSVVSSLIGEPAVGTLILG